MVPSISRFNLLGSSYNKAKTVLLVYYLISPIGDAYILPLLCLVFTWEGQLSKEERNPRIKWQNISTQEILKVTQILYQQNTQRTRGNFQDMSCCSLHFQNAKSTNS